MRVGVAGAGFSGATVARVLADAGHDVVVHEVRSHIAGNAYDYRNDIGVLVHSYGPHLFHTKNRRVWEFLSRFTGWFPYEHRVKALLPDGTHVPFPPNRTTRVELALRGLDPIETFYRPYTRKMWGKELEEVAPGILSRVPGRDDDEDRYFPDAVHQGMPDRGYTELVRRMLYHPRIELRIGRMHRLVPWNAGGYDHVFSTAPIDTWYEEAHGPLEYRSIRFHTQTVPVPRALPSATMNFTHDGPFTRVTEWKHLPGNEGADPFRTTLTVEEPCDFRDNHLERYYPVNDEANRARLALYRGIKDPRVTHLGRCGSFTYLDMDAAVNQALQKVENFLRVTK